MALLNEFIEIQVAPRMYKYYEDLGYKLPWVYDDKHKTNVVKRGSYIKIKIKDLPIQSAVKVAVKCDYCGKEYQMRYQSYTKTLREDGSHYCIKCAHELFFSGANNNKYNPDLSDEDRVLGRNYQEYDEFVRRVLARDEYICQCCKKSESRLVVHHLDGYHWEKEKRIVDTNGITLCEKCHKNFHIKYGLGNNTKTQFEEWMGGIHLELKKYEGVLPDYRKIICYETQEIYEGVQELLKSIGLKSTARIYHVCNRTPHTNTKGSTFVNKTIRGKHYFWYDEYIELSKEKIEEIVYAKRDSSNAGRPIICLETKKKYKTITQAANALGIDGSGLVLCCNGKQNYVTNQNDGKRYTFMYVDEYDKSNETVIKERKEKKYIFRGKISLGVRCKNTNEIFINAFQASEKYGVASGNITKACKGEIKYSGKDENGEKLKWEFIEIEEIEKALYNGTNN